MEVRKLFPSFLLSVAWGFFSLHAHATCLELTEPKMPSPGIERGFSPKQAVQIGWKTCNRTDRYILKMVQGNGQMFRHELSFAQKGSQRRTLRVKKGETYILRIEQLSPEGKVLAKSERPIIVPGTPSLETEGRQLTSIGGFSTAEAPTNPRWIEFSAGGGMVSYSSTLSYERDGFSLPAVNLGFHTLTATPLGFDFELTQTLGRRGVSATNSVANFTQFTADVNYKFFLNPAFTLAPEILFSQQSMSLVNQVNNQVNSLSHLGIGLKAFWSKERFGSVVSLSFAPGLGDPPTRLHRWELSFRPGYEISSRISVQVPLTYRFLYGTTIEGKSRVRTLSGFGAISYAF